MEKAGLDLIKLHRTGKTYAGNRGGAASDQGNRGGAASDQGTKGGVNFHAPITSKGGVNFHLRLSAEKNSVYMCTEHRSVVSTCLVTKGVATRADKDSVGMCTGHMAVVIEHLILIYISNLYIVLD